MLLCSSARRSLLTIFSVSVTSISTYSCGATNFNNTNSLPKAIVSHAQFSKALKIAADTTQYLPYAYADDGCYARSLYMAMEMADAGIPSSQVIAMAPPGKYLRFEEGDNIVQWSWHVAPLLVDGGKLFVVDPAMESQEPTTLDTWVSNLIRPELGNTSSLPTMDEIKFKAILGMEYTVVPGAMNGKYHDKMGIGKWMTHDQLPSVPWIRSLPELGHFDLSVLESACATMHVYSENVPDTAARQQKLTDRTVQLLKSMKSKGLVNGIQPDTLFDCGGMAPAQTL
jgi:hypothetical protein